MLLLKERVIPSIDISDIDLDNCYYNPGCVFNLYKPNSVKKMVKLLNEHFGPVKFHDICCHHDPKIPKGSTIINSCAGCDKRFGSLYEGINTITLWEIIDSISNFPLPKYENMEVSVHDSCFFKSKPQVHQAVRNLLTKMNIDIIESPFSREKSVCCGDGLYQILPEEQVIQMQIKRANQMPCDDVAVYCMLCAKSMAVGGKTPHHLIDLILDDVTYVNEIPRLEYNITLNEYISVH